MDFPISDRATGLALIQHYQRRAVAAGIRLREPPPEPTGCCGRGCNGCLWEGWFSAVAYWCDEAVAAMEG
jgi:hypothetical protein